MSLRRGWYAWLVLFSWFTSVCSMAQSAVEELPFGEPVTGSLNRVKLDLQRQRGRRMRSFAST